MGDDVDVLRLQVTREALEGLLNQGQRGEEREELFGNGFLAEGPETFAGTAGQDQGFLFHGSLQRGNLKDEEEGPQEGYREAVEAEEGEGAFAQDPQEQGDAGQSNEEGDQETEKEEAGVREGLDLGNLQE